MRLWRPQGGRLIVPDRDIIGIRGKVCAVLRDTKTGKTRIIEGRNLVTNDGDLYYAERGALLTTGTPISPVPTNFTDTNGVPDMIMEVGTDATPPAADKTNNRSALTNQVVASQKAMDAGYPKVNDLDADNTGKGADIVTYKVSWTTGDFNATGITQVCITNPSPIAAEVLLTYIVLTSFNKTSTDTLTMYINHSLTGV